MRIAFYMPFKPPDHANPSGDLITGRELRDYLGAREHRLELASTVRSRWLYWRPGTFLKLLQERRRIDRWLAADPADLWLTYHSYYKAPDLLGPACSGKADIPYVIFQGIYSTKRRRSLKTLPGFLLNRRALMAARMVYVNKKRDEVNLLRLLPPERVRYIAPGLRPAQFPFDSEARRQLREQWQVGDRPVVLSAAMLRPGVKSAGVGQVIDSCADLVRAGRQLHLIVIGDGRGRAALEAQARQRLGPACRFLGRIERAELYRYYSAADLFAFPGIDESLGMVYLEAQAAGLPVVAFGDWGGAEAVVDERTGLLAQASQPATFTAAIDRLLSDSALRQGMGLAARAHIRRSHDLNENYRILAESLQDVVSDERRRCPARA